MDFENLTSLAQAECRRVIAELPAELAPVVKEVPIFFEKKPSPTDVESGLDPDTLGLFDPGWPTPAPRIRLWLENLWEFSEEDREVFIEEVRVTVLHEIGHLIGWDEDELEARGLD